MATPIKLFSRILISDKSVCISCSTSNTPKFFIVKNNTQKGAAFDTVSRFYSVNFDLSENAGAYVCRACLRRIERIESLTIELDNLKETLKNTTQKFTHVSAKKRSLKLTPSSASSSKKSGSTPKRPNIYGRQRLFQSHRPTTETEPVELPGYEDLAQPLDLDEQVCQNPIELVKTDPVHEKQATPHKKTSSPTKVKRKQVITFMSIDLVKKMLPIVKKIAAGRITSAVESLLKREEERQMTLTAVIRSIDKECKEFSKKSRNFAVNKSSVTDIKTFDIDIIKKEFENSAPALWQLTCAAATSTNTKEVHYIKVCSALCILLNSRSKFINYFQKVLAVTLSKYHLQKEGFMILSKLGISVSYTSLNSILDYVQSSNDKRIMIYKDKLSNFKNVSPQPLKPVEDEHSYSLPLPITEINEPTNCPPGYTLVMDNIDFHIKARNMTIDHQNQSKHYVQIMTVIDRVLVDHLPNDHPIGNISELENCDFLPSTEDVSSLRGDMIHVVANILVENLEPFKVFSGIYNDYFTHQYSMEMSGKSEMIPLGIIMKNENKSNDMIEILEYLHKYVPGARSDVSEVCHREEDVSDLRSVPVGGDQLTCERMRSAHLARLDADSPEERLEGVLAMVEDFHEKMNFLQATMDRFYKTSSASERGSLYQIRNAISRKNVVKNVTSDYFAVSSFVDLVTECHIIVAALELLEMNDISSPCKDIPMFIDLASKEDRKKVLDQISSRIVDTYFLNSLADSLNKFESGGVAGDSSDGVHNYAVNFTKYGLLRKIAVMSTRSGDGMRVMRHWRYAFLVYDLAHKYKYRLESFLLTAGVKALYTPRQCRQIVWNRFVNLSGGPDKNLDGDYVLELLNGYAKSKIKTLGPNHTADVVDRIGRTMLFCSETSKSLERTIGVAPVSRYHTKADASKDMKIVIKELQSANVFKIINGRQHSSFAEKYDLFHNIKIRDLFKYIAEKKKEYTTNRKYAF